MSKSGQGAWTADKLKDTVSAYSGTQYYSNLPDTAQFVHSVAKILVMRMVKDKVTLCSSPSLYVLGPKPDVHGIDWKRQPSFSMGGVEVAGNVWFGAPAMNVSNGTACQAGADVDARFLHVSGVLGSGGLPAILFDGTAVDNILRFYPKGVDCPDECEDVSLTAESINDESLRLVMNRIHQKSLHTPTVSLAAGKIWNDSSKHFPDEHAEREIQGIVEVGLVHSFGSVRVLREVTGGYGRYDLALLEQDPLDPTKVTNVAILELKVVKAFSSTGKPYSDAANQTAIVKGLKQAFAYRVEHKSRISALCCYDMRPNPSLHRHSTSSCVLATDLKVLFWAWPLVNSADNAREALVQNYLGRSL